MTDELLIRMVAEVTALPKESAVADAHTHVLPPSTVMDELSHIPPTVTPTYCVVETLDAARNSMETKLTVVPKLATPADVSTAPFSTKELPLEAPPTMKA